MPASPARPSRGRVRRLAAGVSASALAASRSRPPPSPPTARSPSAPPRRRRGRGATALRPRFRSRDADAVRHLAADVCDTTLVHVDGCGHALARDRGGATRHADVDLYVYRSDAFGLAGPLVGVSAGTGPDEAVDLPSASGSYLVAAVSFSTGRPASRAARRWPRAPPAIPDVDHPRGRQEALVSDPRAGAASQPVVAGARVTATCSSRPTACSRIRPSTRAGSRPRSRSTAASAGSRSARSRPPRPRTPRSRSTPTATPCWSPTSSRRLGSSLRRWSRPSRVTSRATDVGGADRARRASGRRDRRAARCSPPAAGA